MSDDWQREAREMPAPSSEEIDEWADGIVYGRTPGGVVVYFDPRAGEWRASRATPNGSETSGG